MRSLLPLLLAAVVLSGCGHPRPDGSSSRKPAPAASKTGSTAQPKPRAVNDQGGRIASVNPSLRFVVVDFSFAQAPSDGQRMNVYRQGQKVAEIKISGPARNNVIAADVVVGEARLGDEVRAD